MHCLESGDYIGVESCFDLRADTEDNISQWLSGGGGGPGGGEKKEERWMKKVTAKRYPPSIPSHMPWQMKRCTTEDGRLIIKVEKATRRLEYFEARRSEGRLRLYLVQFDHAVLEDCDGDQEVVEGMNGSASVNGGDQSAGKKIDGGDDARAVLADCRGCDGGGNKCSNSLSVGVAVSEIRHVLHT